MTTQCNPNAIFRKPLTKQGYPAEPLRGGHLSHSYTWGWTHLGEALRLVRGQAGERHARLPGVALYKASVFKVAERATRNAATATVTGTGG
jgi:hypothetical protein